MIATSGVVAPICHSLCFLTPDIPLTMTMDAINSEFDIQSQIHLKVEKLKFCILPPYRTESEKGNFTLK